MLLRIFKLQPLSHKPHFHALQSLSLLCTTPPSNDAVRNISNLIKKPNWQNNTRLKSLVSHLNPHSVSTIIASHATDIPLCLKFVKWVCKQSTYCYDIDSRIQLVYLLASDNSFGLLHKVLVWLIRECCSCKDDIFKLMVAVDGMREKCGFRVNYPCYSVLLMCLAKLDMGLMAFLVFKRMLEDGFVASEIDYRMIVNALCKNGFVQAAEMFVSRVLKLGFALDVYVYTSLVLGNCRAGEIGDALKVFDLMSERDGCGVNSVTYTILVHGLCEVGRLDEACRLKEEMSEKGCKPSIRTYTVLMKAMSDRGLIDQAFGLLDEMIKEGCKPNVHTYTVIVDMLCREGRIEEANGMFRKMLKDGLNPGVVTYNALINCYCKEGRVVSAFELLGLMERRQCKPNIRTYNELIEGLCKIDRPYKAVALLGKVINEGLFPSEVTFNILIVGFCRAGEINMALKILHSMSSFGIKPDRFSYTAFIDAFCKMKRIEQAQVFVALMIKKGISLDEVALTALIHGYCQNGNIKLALLSFEEMVKDRSLTSPHTFNIFLDVLGKEVKPVEKNVVLGKMLRHGLVPSVVTYTILVDGLCRAGDIETSLKMLALMKRVSCPPNVYTYTIVINCLCKSGKFEDAENLLIEMQKNDISPNDIVYALLIKSQAEVGRLNHAFEIVRTMIENGCRTNDEIYFALLSGIFMLENAGSNFVNFYNMEMTIHHAFQLVNGIREMGGDPFDVYKFLIRGLCRTGRILEADTLLQEMVKNGLTPDRDICGCIITHFCERDNYIHSLEWIKRLAAYGCIPSFSSYSAVIIGLQNEGRFHEADWLISDLIRTAGIEDQSAISPYINFLLKGEKSCQSFELLNFAEQICHKERPIF